MEIAIPVKDKLEMCRSYINFINYVADAKITKGEAEILCQIMARDDSSRKPEDRAALLLDQKTVKEPILFELGISYARFANVISTLKKKGVFTKQDNGHYLIHPVYTAPLESKDFNIKLSWEVNQTIENYQRV